jgi:putative toxin-antitoxin system antitoxin component (TIGR02293 family)
MKGMSMNLKNKPSYQNIASDYEEVYGSTPILTALGGASVLNVNRLENDFEKGELTRRGLAKKVALHLQALLKLTGQQMSEMLDISYRTYQRKKDDDLLGPYSSEQLIEIAEVIAHATDVFGDMDTAVDWLNSPILGLNGQKPVSFLDNTFGIRLVRQALGRLEYGIHA